MQEQRAIYTDGEVRAFFHENLAHTVHDRGLDISESATVYIANLLLHFVRSDCLFEWTPDGYRLRALADFYSDAVYATSSHERHVALRRLGDVALFIAGIFSGSLRRRGAGERYYISMGESAYGSLSEGSRDRLFMTLYAELAGNFSSLVGVLKAFPAEHDCGSDSGLIRMYQRWLSRQSKESADELLDRGIRPVPVDIKTQH